MSLLDRLGRGHLSDRQVADLWAASLSAPATHPHLDACAECRARYAAFDDWAAGLGDALRVEAEEAFPAERLSIQQAQIARRLEALERPARVIAFPKAARAVISGNSHVRRWVTVAAAAGLIAGIGLGQLGQVLPLRNAIQTKSPVVAVTPPTNLTAPVAQDRAKVLTEEATASNEDDLLTDIIRAPRVNSLSALDDMTPHARDLALGSRAK